MAVKVIFIGNPLAGDDGIGPCLYNELKEDPRLKDYKLLDLGVIGIDLISYVEDNDKLIIVDAVHSDKDVGKVQLLEEKDLTSDLPIVSQHDFGVEETAGILRVFKPKLRKINLIGINVNSVSAFSNKLSDDLVSNMTAIKESVIEHIDKIDKDS